MACFVFLLTSRTFWQPAASAVAAMNAREAKDTKGQKPGASQAQAVEYILRYRVEDDEASYETSLMLCRAAITSDTGDKENQKALVVTGVSLLCSCAESRRLR